MIIPTFKPYRRKFSGPYEKDIEFVVVENRHGSVVHWMHRSGVNPIATIDTSGKLSLLERPKTDLTSVPLHLYHALLHLQTRREIQFGLVDEIIDTRHRIAVAPQTIDEAKASLDKIIPAVVAELDFIYLSDEPLEYSPQQTVINAMLTTCIRTHIPRRLFNVDAELRDTPITPAEQSVVDHIANELFYVDGIPLSGVIYKELFDYVDVKVEQVLQEMNGALGMII